ncbi:hypothetical protein HMPREF0083_05895 [Aneurinibacillus aneurinilyticus ATCC 12856]|uniref:Uncharacterized protein n=1 Tax=Aneurinibacillus aneurinilyticus ATCC 12856 TaxID=649747 RepID=U1Y1S1_ANEAE|nr:hypothetical protein HMPREF0083_05895 [Aneurinibacillus aneurinilyticus ATCC 12856]
MFKYTLSLFSCCFAYPLYYKLTFNHPLLRTFASFCAMLLYAEKQK